MQPILLSSSENSLEIVGVPGLPPENLIMPLLPDIFSLRSQQGCTTLESCLPLGPLEREILEIRSTPSWPEMAYGALRYWHAALHAVEGRVVLDAALVEKDGLGLLIIGSGKSFFATRCADMASIISDDTVIIEKSFDKSQLVATGWCRPVIRSRAGCVGRPSAQGMSTAIVSAVAFVDGAYTSPSIGAVSDVDARARLLQASIGKVLNSRSKPPSFKETYIGSTSAAKLVADRVTGWCLPSYQAVGAVSLKEFWEGALNCVM